MCIRDSQESSFVAVVADVTDHLVPQATAPDVERTVEVGDGQSHVVEPRAVLRRENARRLGVDQVRRDDVLIGEVCLLYTSDAADDLLCVDLGGRRIIKKK